MNLSAVMGAIRRQWLAGLLVGVLTLGLAAKLWTDASPRFSSSATVSVVASQSYLQSRATAGVGDRNPYSGAPYTLASLLSDLIENGGLRTGIEDSGVTVSVIEGNPARAESFFRIVLTAPSVDMIDSSYREISGRIPMLLEQLQTEAGVPNDQLFDAMLATSEETPELAYPDRARVVIGTVLAGGLLVLLLSVALDSYRTEGSAATKSSNRASASSRPGNGMAATPDD